MALQNDVNDKAVKIQYYSSLQEQIVFEVPHDLLDKNWVFLFNTLYNEFVYFYLTIIYDKFVINIS